MDFPAIAKPVRDLDMAWRSAPPVRAGLALRYHLRRVDASDRKVSGPLQGIAIVDLGLGPVTGLATMVLADFGADVIKVEPPGGDPFLAMPSSRAWMRGKSTLEVDLDDPRALQDVRSLIVDGADAVVTTLGRERRQALGLDYATLSETRSDLVYGVVSGFGEDGPYRDYAAVEAVVAAKFGRMMSLEGVAHRRGPCYAAVQVATHAASQAVAMAVLGSLCGRRTSGRGFVFDTSLLRGLLPQDVSGVQTTHLRERGILSAPETATDPVTVMPRLYYHSARTKDGRWIQFGNLLPHLHQNFLAVAGLDGRSPDAGSGDLEAFRNLMLKTMESASLDEWMEKFVRHGGVAAHPYQTTQAAMDDPDIVANGHVVTIDGVAQLGPIAELTETPATIGGAPRRIDFGRARELFGIFGEGKGRGDSNGRGRRSSVAPASRRPLEGVTVIEAATIIAVPLGTSTLADMGARIIKFEPPGGDPFREMMVGAGAARCNTGKESICLDLKSPQAREIASRLVEKADILVHNYRPGVPERLGLDYDTLARVKPDLVYLASNGYGRKGPGARRPSTHPIPGAALGGVVWQMGGLPTDAPLALDELREVTRALFRANDTNPDPNTSMVVATAAVLGLLAREMTGKGQQVFLDMFGANAYANWDDFVSYPGKPERPRVDKGSLGLSPWCRLYECRSGWVFLHAEDDDARTRLGANDEAELETMFRTDDADAWEARLNGDGIACVRADAHWPAEFLLRDPHAQVEELVVTADHAQWGDYKRQGPLVRFERGGCYPGACLAGEHSVQLLEELGLASEVIDRLLDDGVVAQYASPP